MTMPPNHGYPIFGQSYLPPPIPWPDDTGQQPVVNTRSTGKAVYIALGAVSVLAVAAVVIAMVFAYNVGSHSPESKTSSAQSNSSSSVPTTLPPRQSADERRLDRSSYAPLTTRDFALMAKNPDAWTDRKVIVYGVVTQFDTATGPTAFRADTAATPESSPYKYDQNTLVTARDAAIVANVVEKDLVTMYVEVQGSYTYDTQIGGSTTVPLLAVNIIDSTTATGSPPTVQASTPRASSIPSASPSAPTTPSGIDPASQLSATADSDRSWVAAQLGGKWAPQLSSKRPGLVAEGITWTNAAILAEYQQLRQRYPGARLLRSGDWSTFSASDFWVTVAGVSFSDSAGALAWCIGQGFDRDHCFAKLISTTHPVEGSTAYNK
jgi:hypothetical protein